VSRATSLQFDHCREKVRILHDALDIDEFDARAAAPLLRAELGVGEETVIFGSLGRILPRKGFIELVRATRIVIDRLAPEQRARCRFVVLGDTPQDMQPDHLEECRALVRQLGLGEHVHFLGFRPEVRPYVADFDVSIVPSVYEDPLPRAVLESMAMSKPVIAFDVGGMGEMIEDGVEGRLLGGRPPDIEALAMACLSYFDDAEIWRRRGAAARQRIERDFDARKHAASLQDVMLRITGSNEARA
jgi:glycosyltransferase involved in cell wall biosynthesis